MKFLTILIGILLIWTGKTQAQDLPLSGLQIKTVAQCADFQNKIKAPCVVLTNPNEENVIYLAIFNQDGTEMEKIVRQDFTTGKEKTIWTKPVLKDPSTPKYPQKK